MRRKQPHVLKYSTDWLHIGIGCVRDPEDMYRNLAGRYKSEDQITLIKVYESDLTGKFPISYRPNFFVTIRYAHPRVQTVEFRIRYVPNFRDPELDKVSWHSGDPEPDGFLKNEYILDHILYTLRTVGPVMVARGEWRDHQDENDPV